MARILTIGGTGVISAPCTAALLAAGHEVTAFRRGTARPAPLAPGLATRTGDRDDPAALGRALADTAPEVVIDFACFTEAQAAALLEALPASCRQLVFVSTVDVYGLPLPRLPMAEARPWAAPGSAYAAAKARIEALLAAGLARGPAALTIVRPTYSLGEGFLISLFDRSGAELVARLRQGLPVLLPDGGERLIHPSDARDSGRLIAMAAGVEAAFGSDLTVGTPGAAIRQRDYLGQIAAALGVVPRFREVAAAELARPGLLAPDSLWRELTCHSLAYDLAAASAAFPAFRPAGGIRDLVRAYAARLDPGSDGPRSEGPEAAALRALAGAA